jgi:NADPH-dependent glutamate synthase beta subunit-like oxidoreductase
MDIPLMNRLLALGKIDEALKIVKKDIVLPSVLGRICPAPCEGACRRKSIDEPVSICLLKRYAGDVGDFTLTEKPRRVNKNIAVIGAGPAGLSAAYYLQLKGFQTVIFDKNKEPAGTLMYSIPDEKLDKVILSREINSIKNTGVTFKQNTLVTRDTFLKLIKEYDAVIVATGDFSGELSGWGLKNDGKQILVDKKTYQTNLPNVFAIGNVNRSTKYAIRSVGQGKEVAFSIEQLLTGEKITGEPRLFNSRFGKLVQEEYHEYLKESTNDKKLSPATGHANGFTLEEVKKEAARCLHCDCRKPVNCKLRVYSDKYSAMQNRFNYENRKPVKKFTRHDIVVYEPEKCIKCGICVRMTQKYNEDFGFTFIGRGFDVKIGAPFNEQLNRSLTKTAKLVAEACPTGALALK